MAEVCGEAAMEWGRIGSGARPVHAGALPMLDSGWCVAFLDFDGHRGRRGTGVGRMGSPSPRPPAPLVRVKAVVERMPRGHQGSLPSGGVLFCHGWWQYARAWEVSKEYRVGWSAVGFHAALDFGGPLRTGECVPCKLGCRLDVADVAGLPPDGHEQGCSCCFCLFSVSFQQYHLVF